MIHSQLTLFLIFLFRTCAAIASMAVGVMFCNLAIQLAEAGEVLSTVFTSLGVITWAAIATIFLVYE